MPEDLPAETEKPLIFLILQLAERKTRKPILIIYINMPELNNYSSQSYERWQGKAYPGRVRPEM